MFERELRAVQERLVRNPSDEHSARQLIRLVERNGYAASVDVSRCISVVADLAIEDHQTEKCMTMVENMANSGITTFDTMQAVWKLAHKLGRMPKITGEAYMASDPSLLPNVSLIDRVTITRSSGEIVQRWEYDGSEFQAPVIGDAWRRPQSKWSPYGHFAYVVDFMTLLNEVGKRESKKQFFVRHYNPRNFWVNGEPYVRRRNRWVKDDNPAWYHRVDGFSRDNTYSNLHESMGHYEEYLEDPDDANPSTFRVRSEMGIYTVGSPPMFHSMGDEEFKILKTWANAQEK